MPKYSKKTYFLKKTIKNREKTIKNREKTIKKNEFYIKIRFKIYNQKKAKMIKKKQK